MAASQRLDSAELSEHSGGDCCDLNQNSEQQHCCPLKLPAVTRGLDEEDHLPEKFEFWEILFYAPDRRTFYGENRMHLMRLKAAVIYNRIKMCNFPS